MVGSWILQQRRLSGLCLGAVLAMSSGCSSGPLRAEERAVPPPGRVRVLSLNTWLLPVASQALEERLARLPAAIAAHEPDVICLQEVWTPQARIALEKGLEGWHASSARGGGLLTLSRWPIVRQHLVRFTPVPGLSLEERIAGKGLLLCEVAAPGGPLRVANTHVAFGDPGNDPQNAELLALLAQLGDLPLVVAGDLNRRFDPWRPDGPAVGYRPWWQEGFVHVDPLVAGTTGEAASVLRTLKQVPTRSGWPPLAAPVGWTPDHMLVRDGDRRAVNVRTYRVVFQGPGAALSDHHGLLVDLELSP
jgi:endonuclease/exonuclease/phosphatase family metal-dependent hydrolase